jgi:hypothetical protein
MSRAKTSFALLSPAVLFVAGCARSPEPRLSPVAAVTSSLHAVATAEEKYYTEHGTYTTEVGALRRYPGCSVQPGVTITIHEANADGWAASGFHPGFASRSCVQWFSLPGAVAVPVTALERLRGDSIPGGVVCDPPAM